MTNPENDGRSLRSAPDASASGTPVEITEEAVAEKDLLLDGVSGEEQVEKNMLVTLLKIAGGLAALGVGTVFILQGASLVNLPFMNSLMNSISMSPTVGLVVGIAIVAFTVLVLGKQAFSGQSTPLVEQNGDDSDQEDLEGEKQPLAGSRLENAGGVTVKPASSRAEVAGDESAEVAGDKSDGGLQQDESERTAATNIQ